MSICLFLSTGRTFTFHNTKIVTNNETVLVFDYTAMSDGKLKCMTVQKSQVIGWSQYE